MKTQLIKTQDKFILVSDELIGGDNCWTTKGLFKKSMKDGGIFLIDSNGEYSETYWDFEDVQKIIAGIPELPSIDFSLLSEEDCKKIGWYDVEKLCETNYPLLNVPEGSNIDWQFRLGQREGYFKGFNTAKSLNDKRFSLKDMRKAFHRGRLFQETSCNPFDKESANSVIKDFTQSLQQISWDVEVEMEEGVTNLCDCYYTKFCKSTQLEKGVKCRDEKHYKPKITNNSIKIIKLL